MQTSRGVFKRNTRVTSDNRVMTNGRSVPEGGLKRKSWGSPGGGGLSDTWPLTCQLIIWRGVQDAETRSENTETLWVHHFWEASSSKRFVFIEHLWLIIRKNPNRKRVSVSLKSSVSLWVLNTFIVRLMVKHRPADGRPYSLPVSQSEDENHHSDNTQNDVTPAVKTGITNACCSVTMLH